MLFLGIVLTFFGATSAQIIFSGSCDVNATTVKNFDVEKYTGVWYEIYRYEQVHQFGGDCVTATYTLENDTLKVLNRMVLLKTAFQITGTATIDPNAAGEGKLIVNFPSVNASSPYWVLSTDYTAYSLVYLCLDLDDGNKQVSSWILSRKPNISPQAVLAMNELIESIDGLDWDSYRFTNHSESSCKLKTPSDTPMIIGESFNPPIPSKSDSPIASDMSPHDFAKFLV